MKIINVEQGSEQWLKIRLCLISASRFKDLMSNGRGGGLSVTAQSYMKELIAEILTDQQKEISGKALEWGSTNEERACVEYEMDYNKTVDHQGICLSDNNCFGASPDGFVGDDGMIEIKCPYNSANHITAIMDGMPKEHIPQIQGNMWINGRDWCDFISFDPRIDGDNRLYVERIERDDKYIAELEVKANAFLLEMKRILSQSFNINWNGVDVDAILNNELEK